MKTKATDGIPTTPILFPYEPEQYWQTVREIIREELQQFSKGTLAPVQYQTPGMEYKPLYKIGEVCQIFHVTRPTIYDWIKHGKLKPYKIRSRVFFLWKDIELLLEPSKQSTPENLNPAK